MLLKYLGVAVVLQKGKFGLSSSQLCPTWLHHLGPCFSKRERSSAAAEGLSEEAQELVQGQDHCFGGLDPLFFLWFLLRAPWLSARPGAAFALPSVVGAAHCKHH